jgi:ribosomal protein S27AE
VVAGEATRGAVWTRRELLEVLTVRLSKAVVRRVVLARVLFDGELGEVALAVCYACRGRDWWRARDQRRVCRRCHPPVSGAEAGTATGKASEKATGNPETHYSPMVKAVNQVMNPKEEKEMASVALTVSEYEKVVRDGELCKRCGGHAVVVDRPDWSGHGRLICGSCEGIRLEIRPDMDAPEPEQVALPFPETDGTASRTPRQAVAVGGLP